VAKGGEGVTRGLVLGKFLPPHRGHQHLVDAAREQVDELVVLVCSLRREDIAGERRVAWMRELHPDCRVIHVSDENPSEPHEHPDFWRFWIETIRRACPEPIDVVFTSEPYGDELAGRLGARHVEVDRERRAFPVSGTAVRRDPYAHWSLLPPPVRAHFVKRVVITGPESTGKTTLARDLAAHFGTVWIPEYGRVYLDGKGSACVEDDIPLIAEGQIQSEDEAARRANRILFCDTDLMVTRIWSEHYFGACRDWIVEAARARRYDVHLLLDVDVPWVDDPQRDCGHLRQEFLERFRRELAVAGRRVVEVRGSWDERRAMSIASIDALFR